MKLVVKTESTWLRPLLIFSLLISVFLVPISTPQAQAAIVGTDACASDVTYAPNVESKTADGQCVLIFKGTSNAGGNAGNGWTVPAGITKVQILLIGGGGSGGRGGPGSYEAGGGGAGGLILAETSTVPGTKYDFVIGSGGSGTNKTSGNSSAAFGFEAYGGGYGGGSDGSNVRDPSSGGSGGGGGHNQRSGGATTQTIGRGNNGGTPGTASSGAGGGGAGGRGLPSVASAGNTTPYIGGAGGPGFKSSISGEEKFYAGGGGGTGSDGVNVGDGGSGVGGKGDGSAGVENTGSGGGGMYGPSAGPGGNGGSGVLIIRWTPIGFTNSLKMFVKDDPIVDSGTTRTSTFTEAGKFFTTCSPLENVFPYAGKSTAGHDWGSDEYSGSPDGCRTNGFTMYATGWIKAPSSSFKMFTKGDDGSRVDINNTTLVNYVYDNGGSLKPETNTVSNQISGLTAGSWYRIDVWLHENGGGAGLEILWSTDGGINVTSIPSTNLTYQFPSNFASVSTTNSFVVRESSTVTTSLDTTTAKVYNDSGSSLLSQSGYFQVVDSGTVSTTCASSIPNSNGVASCNWRPETAGLRTVSFQFISTDTLGVNGEKLFLSSTASTQISSARQVLSVSAMYASSDTDTAINLSGSQYLSLRDSTGSIFDLTGNITIEAWVKPTDCSANLEMPVVHKLNSYSLYCKSGTWWYKFAGTSTSWSGVNTGIPVQTGKWQNVSLTRLSNSNAAAFYLDGRTETMTGTFTADGAGSGSIAVNNNDFEIGAVSSEGRFSGQIDEVRLFNAYRYSSQISTDINSYLSISTSGLVAYYDMNEYGAGVVHNRVSGSSVSQDLLINGSATFSGIAETTVSAGITTVIFNKSFLTAGSGWKMPAAKSNVSVLLVGGGGGGGGGYQGGGGGAGGMIESTVSLSATFYPVKVGLGGAGRKTECTNIPTNGESTTAFSLIAAGGGSGGYEYQCGGLSDNSSGVYSYGAPQAGGSGGGGNWTSFAGGLGTAGQGNSGGASLNLENSGGYYTTTRYGGAGGGGAGSAGVAPTGTKNNSPTLIAKGGNGGTGKYSELVGAYLAGGGGGSIRNADSIAFKGVGGNGGGGDSSWSLGMNASNGTPNTGGGGGATHGIYGGDGSSQPESSYILGLSGSGGSGVVALRWSEKTRQAPIYIGQYTAFTGISTYPLNVYGGSGTGALTRTMIDSGTAQCVMQSGFYVQANKIGQCSVSATKAEDANYYAETATATIYWIQWSDAYATRVPSGPTEIVLSHKTQITKYNFETLTVTSYQNGSGGTVTQIAANSQLRIIGDGFDSTDSTTEVVFGNAEIVDMNYSTPALQIVSDGSGGYYLLVTVPSAATTDVVLVNSRKGTAAGPTLTITP